MYYDVGLHCPEHAAPHNTLWIMSVNYHAQLPARQRKWSWELGISDKKPKLIYCGRGLEHTLAPHQ